MKLVFLAGFLAVFSGYSNASVDIAKDILISRVDISSGGATVYFLSPDNSFYKGPSDECENGFSIPLDGSAESKRFFSIVLAGKTFNGMADMAFDDSSCVVKKITVKYGQTGKGDAI